MQKITKLMLAVIALVVLSITVFPQTLKVLGKSPEKPKSYYLDEIKDTAQKVKALTKEPALVFFLCSDVHYNTVKTDNRLKLDSVTDMTTNMAALKKQIQVDGLICLGDIVDAKPPTKMDETKQQIDYVMKQLQGVGVPLIYSMGNHDDNRYISRKDGTVLTPQQIESMFMRYTLPNKVIDPSMNGLNYYVDYDRLKIRVFVVDSNYPNPASSARRTPAACACGAKHGIPWKPAHYRTPDFPPTCRPR